MKAFQYIGVALSFIMDVLRVSATGQITKQDLESLVDELLSDLKITVIKL